MQGHHSSWATQVNALLSLLFHLNNAVPPASAPEWSKPCEHRNPWTKLHRTAMLRCSSSITQPTLSVQAATQCLHVDDGHSFIQLTIQGKGHRGRQAAINACRVATGQRGTVEDDLTGKGAFARRLSFLLHLCASLYAPAGVCVQACRRAGMHTYVYAYILNLCASVRTCDMHVRARLRTQDMGMKLMRLPAKSCMPLAEASLSQRPGLLGNSRFVRQKSSIVCASCYSCCSRWRKLLLS